MEEKKEKENKEREQRYCYTSQYVHNNQIDEILTPSTRTS